MWTFMLMGRLNVFYLFSNFFFAQLKVKLIDGSGLFDTGKAEI